MTEQELSDKVLAALRMTDRDWASDYGEPIEHGYAIRENHLDNLEAEAYAAGLSFEEVKNAFGRAFSLDY